MKHFEFWKIGVALAAACLTLYLLFYAFTSQIVSSLVPNEVSVTTQGSFMKKNVRIDVVDELGKDTVNIFSNGQSKESFKPIGLTRFLVYEDGELLAEFEHYKENETIGNTYHFYLSANEDSVFMDMRVEGHGAHK